MANKKKYSELEQLLRDQGFDDKDFPDVLKVLMSDPQTRQALQSNYDFSEPRRPMKPEGSAATRLAGGLAAAPVEMANSTIKAGFDQAREVKDEYKTKGLMHLLNPFMDHSPGQTYTKELKGQTPSTSIKDTLRGMVDLPGIENEFSKGNTAGAVGRAVTQGVMWGAPFMKGTPKGAGALGKTGEVEKLLSLTERQTQPMFETLSTQAEAIKGGMQGQLSNVAALRGNPVFKKAIARLGDLETAPGTPKGAVSAAKDALESLTNQVNSGKATNWNDLFELNKKLNAANAQIKDASTNAMLRKITDTVNGELSSGAGKVGMGKAYNTWHSQYAKASNLRRTYDDILRGKTDTQMETKATAKGTRFRVAGTSFGSTKASKVAKATAPMIKQAHKAFDELHGQIKANKIPKPVTPPEPPPSAPPAPATGGPSAPAPVAPAAGGAAPQAPQWPASYQNAPKQMSSQGGGGANYTADQLAAFKRKHGIQ